MSNLARQLGVDLVVYGEVDDTELAKAVAEADVVSCLRWPTLEAASGSAIEAMLHGKPIIVSDAGFYKTIPDSCALKIDPGKEEFEVQLHLETLLGNVGMRMSLGSEAKRWAAATFTVENYAQNLYALAVETLKAAPCLEAITAFSGMLQRWGARSDIFECEFLVQPLRIFGADENWPITEPSLEGRSRN